MPLEQKMAKNKMFLEFFFRRGLFYAKMPNYKIANLYLTPFRPPLGCALATMGDPDQKKLPGQKVLRI
jgi:hypothetical protein